MNPIENICYIIREKLTEDAITHQIKRKNFEEFSVRVKETFAEFPVEEMDKTIDSMQKRMKLIIVVVKESSIDIQGSPLYSQFLDHQKKHVRFVFKTFTFGYFFSISVLFCSYLGKKYPFLLILMFLCCVYLNTKMKLLIRFDHLKQLVTNMPRKYWLSWCEVS